MEFFAFFWVVPVAICHTVSADKDLSDVQIFVCPHGFRIAGQHGQIFYRRSETDDLFCILCIGKHQFIVLICFLIQTYDTVIQTCHTGKTYIFCQPIARCKCIGCHMEHFRKCLDGLRTDKFRTVHEMGHMGQVILCSLFRGKNPGAGIVSRARSNGQCQLVIRQHFDPELWIFQKL